MTVYVDKIVVGFELDKQSARDAIHDKKQECYKYCPRCKRDKDIKEFYRYNKSKGTCNISNHCRYCQNQMKENNISYKKRNLKNNIKLLFLKIFSKTLIWSS